jgi:lysine 2,3-aminomutase
LQLKLDEAQEFRSVGIAKLLSDFDDALSLVPEDTERMERRNIE